MPCKFLRSACALVATLMLCGSVQAGIFRAYVSSTGSDANPCTLPAPCRLLPAALTAVNDGGEIWMLDSANFNTATVTINKSVTILAIPGVVGSVVATGGGNAITINTASVKVTLKNLVITHLTSSNDGIQFAQGAELKVEDCEVSNIQGNGITAFAPGAKVAVKNTLVRDSNAGVNLSGSLVGVVEGVRVLDNAYGITVGAGARATVSNSVMSGNVFGLIATAFSATNVRVVVERSVMTGNLFGLRADTTNAGDAVEVTASNNTISHNTTAGVYANPVASSTVTIVSDGNTLAENAVGFLFNGGTIYTRGNNTLKFNGSDVTGGSLTVLGAQ